jgi:predicted nucleotidyltransferase
MIDQLDIQKPNFCKLYFFGSVVYAETFNDIDIAVIYEREYISLEELTKFRQTLKEFVLQKTGISSDVILLSKDEEAELAFLSNAKTTKLK